MLLLLFLLQKIYDCKSNIKKALISYHTRNHRTFKIVENNKKRCYIRCSKQEECGFRLHYNLNSGCWVKGNIEVTHDCEEDFQSMIVISKSVDYICTLDEVQKWMKMMKREATTKGLKILLQDIGITPKYHTLLRCLTKLRSHNFIEEKLQFGLLESYVSKLNNKNQFAAMEVDGDRRFKRFCIIYSEGIRGFKAFKSRGLQLDATFLKTSTGGALLIACYKNGNNNIRIVGISVVLSETEASWA